MSAPPKVFISAASGDLRSVRQVVKEALLTINCHPVEQTNFEPDWRTVSDMLKARIEGCQALIHIVGLRYGAEPEAASLPPGTPRRSYTQMEYHLGRQLQAERGEERFRVYTFLCPESFPFDAEPDVEADDLRALQLAHRQLILADPHLREKPRSKDELQARVLALQEQVLALLQEQTELKPIVQRSHRLLVLVLLGLLALGGGLMLMKRSVETLPTRVEDSIRKGYTVDATKIRIQLEASSEKRRDEDIAAANDIKQHPKWDDRQKLREQAEAAHKQRLSRVTEFAQDFADLAAAKDASPVLIEMGRIIETEGVDAALAYFETQRGDVIKRATLRLAVARDAARRDLLPVLQATFLQWTRGQTAAARTSFIEVLKLDPQWPLALDAYGSFLCGQSIYYMHTGPLAIAITYAQECMANAQHYYDLDTSHPPAQRALSTAHNTMGDVLVQRGANGDADQILQHYQQSLVLAEALFKIDPNYPHAARDLFVSLNRLGILLAQRGLPGDAETALKHLTRSLEIAERLLSATPDSAQAARDVSVGLEKLGDFLAQRGQPGDADAALKHYARSLKMKEKLLTATPDSAEAVRDVSVGLNCLGDVLMQLGRPGDVQNALSVYTRSLEQREKLLIANPDSALALRDVSASLDNVGNILVARSQAGDVETALKHYARSLAQREQLLASNPNSAQAARDVYVSLVKLSGLLVKRRHPGDAQAALKNYTRSLEITEKLLAANPDSAIAARDVYVNSLMLGMFLAQRGQTGDGEAAVKHHTHGLEIAEKLLAANPNSLQAAHDVSASLNKLGDLLTERGQPGDGAAALKHLNRNLEITEKVLAANPTSAQAARDVVITCAKLGLLAERTGQGDTKTWWRRPFEVLDGRARKGMFLSAEDKKVLEALRKRAEGK